LYSHNLKEVITNVEHPSTAHHLAAYLCGNDLEQAFARFQYLGGP
jgi:hypothetical protein